MVKDYLRNSPLLWPLVRSVYRWVAPVFTHPFTCWPRYINLLIDWRKYLSAGGKARILDFYPCLFDKTAQTKFDPQYFYQAAWATIAINNNSPTIHVDVGSDIKFVGMLTAITKVKFVDIRPLDVELRNLECISGSIMQLPFEDESLESISSLHVLEHIGLGRYGDPIDPKGAEKSIIELTRVLQVGGFLYISIPVGSQRIQFNSHRTFSPEEIKNLFSHLKFIANAYIDNHGKYHERVDLDNVFFEEKRGADFALACLIFQKEHSVHI
jgi:predicted SAM-dependent methyltransferase